MATVTDDFAGTGALSANWTASDDDSPATTMSRSGGVCISDNAGSDAGYRYTGSSFGNDQYAQVTLNSPAADGEGTGYGVLVRDATSGTTRNLYRLIGNASGYELLKCVSGAFTSLKLFNTTTFANGDVIRLEVSGTGLTCKKNGSSFDTATDSSLASGTVGIAHSSSTSAGSIDNFEGGDLTASTTSGARKLPLMGVA